MPHELYLRPLSSLAKVFPKRIYGKKTNEIHTTRQRRVSFQIACRLTGKPRRYPYDYKIEIKSPFAENISLYTVENVPSTLPAFPYEKDGNFISIAPGVFPDPLVPTKDTMHVTYYNWHSLWVEAYIPENIESGKYPVKLSFIRDGEVKGECTVNIYVYPVELPENTTLFTQWFHCDCIADAHGVAIFSEKHWALIEKYMALAANHGINVIFTPVLTPPLDTLVGGERPTVQLVDITKTDTGYEFDFTRLGRYIEIAHRCGIEIFEINHMFTQWGASFAPKVEAFVNGKKKKIFGWETSATSEEYKAFLSALIPALIKAFADFGVKKDNLIFHVSDEPNEKQLESYKAAVDIFAPLLEGAKYMDALSNVEYYLDGLVPSPVVATNKIDDFLDKDVKDLWCYYCNSQHINVSNRFFGMPSTRNRAIGIQMYCAGIKGFLHWGYNFYYTQYSVAKIDPYRETASGDVFPSGDAFSVYPYKDTAIPSLRLKVFFEALEDIRLLEALEQKIGRETVISALETLADRKITFDFCPTDENFWADMWKYALDALSE